MFLNNLSALMKVLKHDLDISKELLQNANAAFQPPNTIKQAAASPGKTKIKVPQGKITKVFQYY